MEAKIKPPKLNKQKILKELSKQDFLLLNLWLDLGNKLEPDSSNGDYMIVNSLFGIHRELGTLIMTLKDDIQKDIKDNK